MNKSTHKKTHKKRDTQETHKSKNTTGIARNKLAPPPDPLPPPSNLFVEALLPNEETEEKMKDSHEDNEPKQTRLLKKANGQVMLADPNMRIIIFLGRKNVSDCNYCLNPFGSEEYHPFILVDREKFIFVCAFSDHNSDKRSDFVFTICEANAQRSIKAFPFARPQQDKEKQLTFSVKSSIQFINCNLSFVGAKHYEVIISRLVTYILTNMNTKFSPLMVIRIVMALFQFVCGRDYQLVKGSTVRHLMDQCFTSELNKIKNVKSWNEMSRIICILSLKLSFETKLERFVEDLDLVKYFRLVVNEHSNLGTTDDIINNTERLVGEYITFLETKLTQRIIEAKQPIERYRFLLWFNLLHCVVKTNDQTNLDQIRQALTPTLCSQEFFALVDNDLNFVSRNRAIKMEYYFMKNLLAVNSGYKWNARLKYDYFIQLLGKMDDISDISLFLLKFEKGLSDLLAHRSDSMFGFVHYMIKTCQIPKDKKIKELILSGPVIQCIRFTSKMFCHKIKTIDTPEDAAQLYRLCVVYPVLMDKRVKLQILKNEYLVSRREFIPYIVDLLRIDSLTLKRCIAIWLNNYGFMQVIAMMKQFKLDLSCVKEYCIENAISTYIALDFDCDFAVIADNHLPPDLRVIAVSETNKQWIDLTDTKSKSNDKSVDNDETKEKMDDLFAFMKIMMNDELEATHKNDSVAFIQIKRKELKVLQETEEKYRKSIVDLTNRLEDVNKSNEELRKTIQNGKKEATMMNDELHDTIRKFEEKNTLDSDEKEVDYSDKYIIIRELGSGNFGKVVFAKAKKTGKVVAIKIIKDIHNSFNAIHNEISIFKKCNKSKNIVSYIGSQYILESKEFWIVMEFCGGGSVKDMIKYNDKGIRESEIQTCLNDILRGLMYLHERCKPKIIHRDIKPDNILIDNYGVYKLSDFGTSKKMKSELTDTLKKGSPFYMAPEAVNTDEGGYSVMVDIWSVGITVYQMRTASFPQSYIEKKGTFELYLGGMFKNFIAPRLSTNFGHIQNSNEICDFVEKCLQTDPLKRLTAKQLLKHKFVSN